MREDESVLMDPAVSDIPNDRAGPLARRRTVGVRVGNVLVGGGAPIVVQSMTNTDTADIDGTVRQVAALARAGSELVRITVDRDEAAAVLGHRRDRDPLWQGGAHRRQLGLARRRFAHLDDG